jgi:Ca-activated chloride channel family protein
LDLYRAGRYEQAYNAFEDLAREHPGMGNLQFDAGASAYMARHYDEAVDAFGKALTADDPALQAKSHYNFGNALYRRGEEQKNPQQQISDWRNAIQHYDTALEGIKTQPPQPGSTLAGDAAYNREIVQRRLDEALKRPPRQDKQDQQDQPSGSQQQQQPGGGKQERKDQQQSLSEGPSQQQNQSGKRNEQQDKPPQEGASAQSQPTQRPDPASVPNQDKARQRGDFKAQPAGSPKEEQEPSKQEPAEQNGKMTPDQARALLQSLKDEDTSVNLNDDPDNRNRRDEPVIKDW